MFADILMLLIVPQHHNRCEWGDGHGAEGAGLSLESYKTTCRRQGMGKMFLCVYILPPFTRALHISLSAVFR